MYACRFNEAGHCKAGDIVGASAGVNDWQIEKVCMRGVLCRTVLCFAERDGREYQRFCYEILIQR